MRLIPKVNMYTEWPQVNKLWAPQYLSSAGHDKDYLTPEELIHEVNPFKSQQIWLLITDGIFNYFLNELKQMLFRFNPMCPIHG